MSCPHDPSTTHWGFLALLSTLLLNKPACSPACLISSPTFFMAHSDHYFLLPWSFSCLPLTSYHCIPWNPYAIFSLPPTSCFPDSLFLLYSLACPPWPQLWPHNSHLPYYSPIPLTAHFRPLSYPYTAPLADSAFCSTTALLCFLFFTHILAYASVPLFTLSTSSMPRSLLFTTYSIPMLTNTYCPIPSSSAQWLRHPTGSCELFCLLVFVHEVDVKVGVQIVDVISSWRLFSPLYGFFSDVYNGISSLKLQLATLLANKTFFYGNIHRGIVSSIMEMQLYIIYP